MYSYFLGMRKNIKFLLEGFSMYAGLKGVWARLSNKFFGGTFCGDWKCDEHKLLSLMVFDVE